MLDKIEEMEEEQFFCNLNWEDEKSSFKPDKQSSQEDPEINLNTLFCGVNMERGGWRIIKLKVNIPLQQSLLPFIQSPWPSGKYCHDGNDAISSKIANSTKPST